MPRLSPQRKIDHPGKQLGGMGSSCFDVRPNGPNKAMLLAKYRTDFDLNPLDVHVIALTMAGYSLQERAKSMGLSEPAMRRRIFDICHKLGVACEFELILFALYYRLMDTYEAFPSCDREIPLAV